MMDGRIVMMRMWWSVEGKSERLGCDLLAISTHSTHTRSLARHVPPPERRAAVGDDRLQCRPRHADISQTLRAQKAVEARITQQACGQLRTRVLREVPARVDGEPARVRLGFEVEHGVRQSRTRGDVSLARIVAFQHGIRNARVLLDWKVRRPLHVDAERLQPKERHNLRSKALVAPPISIDTPKPMREVDGIRLLLARRRRSRLRSAVTGAQELARPLRTSTGPSRRQ